MNAKNLNQHVIELIKTAVRKIGFFRGSKNSSVIKYELFSKIKREYPEVVISNIVAEYDRQYSLFIEAITDGVGY